MNSIFIVGTGRSGTHFLCRTLRGFSNVDDFRDGKENGHILREVAMSALTHKPLSNNVIEYYKSQIETAKNKNKIFLDQHHPNLFHITQLHEIFPDAIFLATDRPMEQVVASMLNHRGVRSWANNAHKHDYVYPNQFLGIDNIEDTKIESHILCAKRVTAHNLFREYILEKHPDVVRRVLFEDLVNNQIGHLKDVFTEDEFKMLGNYTQKEKPNQNTLSKYSKTINESQIKDIT